MKLLNTQFYSSLAVAAAVAEHLEQQREDYEQAMADLHSRFSEEEREQEQLDLLFGSHATNVDIVPCPAELCTDEIPF